jgi:hypothetical protein
MIRLKIRDSYFQIIDGYRINESSREVTFSSLTVDFTNKTIADLPLKYQEVQLVELDDDYNIIEIIYTGYINNFILPKMKNRNEYRELEVDLISPLGMTTLRTSDAVGTYKLQDLIRRIIQPLIDDGYVLKSLNIGNNQITVNYLNETVESSLNKLSNKFNFWWYIDKHKNIYINSIDYLVGLQPKLIYDNDNPIKGLIDVIPSIDATDYCNTINFTNVRLYTESFFERWEEVDENNIETLDYIYYEPLFMIDTINQGDKIEFEYPINLNKNAIGKISIPKYPQNLMLRIAKRGEGNIIQNVLSISYENGNINIPSNVSIEDSYNDDNTWVLVRDPFFSDLIVGLQYNGEPFDIFIVNSSVGLKWSKVKVSNDIEINKNKGIISKTGIVEKQVDMNEQWKSYQELLEIANSYIKINDSKIEQVKLKMDADNNLEIGDTVKINKGYFLIDDIYIITDKTLVYDNNVKSYSYTLRNTNILENYVDLFRANETEEQENKNVSLITSSYNEEGFKESYEVITNEN